MKKVILIALAALLISITLATYFINEVILPTKIKSLVVLTLENQTRKRVSLGDLRFNIFKGLVFKDLVIADSQGVVFSVRQATCSIFILPIFKKQIIIPGVTLKSPYLFLERFAGNQFNISDFFKPPPPDGQAKPKFNIAIYRVAVSKGNLVFKDNAQAIPFKQEMKNLDLVLGLAFPVSVKFHLRADLPSDTTAKIKASGEYKIISHELNGQVALKSFSPNDFRAYFGNTYLSAPSGFCDFFAQFKFKNDILAGEIEAKADNLIMLKDKFKLKLNANLKSKISYNFKDKKFDFSGKADVLPSDISGIEPPGEINNIRGKVVFDHEQLRCEKLNFEVFGKPLDAVLTVKNFAHPDLSLKSSLELAQIVDIARKKFKFDLIDSAAGPAVLSLNLQQAPGAAWQLRGGLEVAQAEIKFAKHDFPVENINSKIEFTQDLLAIDKLDFNYRGAAYKAGGGLTHFVSPLARLNLASENLILQTDFNLNGKRMNFSRIEGKYFETKFLLSGILDNTDPQAAQVDLNGSVNLNLEDLPKMLPKLSSQIQPFKLSGTLDTQVNLSGRINDFKSCNLALKSASSNFSFYGLHATDFSCYYRQADGLAEVLPLHMALYDGTIDVFAKMNLNSANLPYWVNLQMQGVRLEKLKLDTASRNKDISGDLGGELKVSGFVNDLTKLSGFGRVAITNGKLWELNLFKGMGKLLFADDFANIIFSEGFCAFAIQDSSIFTDNLRLKSNVANLSGPLKIGFDGTLDGALNVEILSEMVPLKGTFKDVTTAIIGSSGVFGVIRLGGTLAQPKYSFKTAVGNIIQGLANMFLKK